jgi:hypothetical protein
MVQMAIIGQLMMWNVYMTITEREELTMQRLTSLSNNFFELEKRVVFAANFIDAHMKGYSHGLSNRSR